jgi:serine/threonine protein kinase
MTSINYIQQDPEEIFDRLEVLGEGSYGTVWKALNRTNGQLYAVKIVPVENDISEVEKEINILRQCESPFIVNYHGSYKKGDNLWIVIEYCGGGSVMDILSILGPTLTEQQIAAICASTLKGLVYLHNQKKIHRDIKAGNILMNENGDIKLADFGVSAQLANTISKRQTVIGTPYWMAPEVIQETSYNGKADVWSLGITAIEMAEGKPPLHGIHPMRAIFMIPNKPPPTFSDKTKWSEDLIDFVAQCLQKNAADRPTSKDLLKHKFIQKAKPTKILTALIDQMNQVFAEAGGRQEYFRKREEEKRKQASNGNDSEEEEESGSETSDDSDSDSDDSGGYDTIKKKKSSTDSEDEEEEEEDDDNYGTIQRKPNAGKKKPKEEEKDSGSDDDDSDDDDYGSTMVRHSMDTIKSQAQEPNNTEQDSVSNLSSFYANMSLDDLKHQLSMLDAEMEKEIETIKATYARRKRAIENTLQSKQK